MPEADVCKREEGAGQRGFPHSGCGGFFHLNSDRPVPVRIGEVLIYICDKCGEVKPVGGK